MNNGFECINLKRRKSLRTKYLGQQTWTMANNCETVLFCAKNIVCTCIIEPGWLSQ